MKVRETEIAGVLVISPKKFEDARGYFMETYNTSEYSPYIGQVTWVQDNESLSSFGVLRGFAFQAGEYAQAKLVRVIKGRVLDVVLDMRQSSPSFGKYFSVELDDKDSKQLFIPRGCAHAFLVLSDCATVSYKVDNFFFAQAESGVRFDDSTIAVSWPIDKKDMIISEKDLSKPLFKNAKYFN